MSGWDGSEKYSPRNKNFYREVLSKKLQHYHPLLSVAELAQDADFLNKEIDSWSNINLMGIRGFITFILTISKLSVHLRHRHVDIASENTTHRQWSLEQVIAGLIFAFQTGADIAILHPGTQNERSGHFWPSASDLPSLLNSRSIALDNSLETIAEVIAKEAMAKEKRIALFKDKKSKVHRELTLILKDLVSCSSFSLNTSESVSIEIEGRIQAISRAIELVKQNELTCEEIRCCVSSNNGLQVAIENLEPPNFLACTPVQLVKIHRKFESSFRSFANSENMPTHIIEHYAPGIALDPGHLLNAKIILTLEQNRPFLDSIDGGEELFGDFVHLPGQYPLDSDSKAITEPVLNKFVRENKKHIIWSYIHGCRRTDTMMTSHGPIGSFRKAQFSERNEKGEAVSLYLMNSFTPDDELNLNEVVQVIGVDTPFIAEVIGAPPEVVESSVTNLSYFVGFLHSERQKAHLAVENAINAEASKDSSSKASQAHLDWLKDSLNKAEFYVRNHSSDIGLWTAGYDEAGFYLYSNDENLGNVNIFATVKHNTKEVWLQGVNGDRLVKVP